MSCRNYHGHIVEHLKIVRDGLAAQSKRSFVYLMGDSSLDNKCGAACVLLRANIQCVCRYWILQQPMVVSGLLLLPCSALTFSKVQACNGYQNLLHPAKSVADVA